MTYKEFIRQKRLNDADVCFGRGVYCVGDIQNGVATWWRRLEDSTLEINPAFGRFIFTGSARKPEIIHEFVEPKPVGWWRKLCQTIRSVAGKRITVGTNTKSSS